MIAVAQFYHVWADGAWEIPLAEHVAAMREAQFFAPLNVGIIGSQANQERVCQWLSRELPGQWELAASAPQGYEEVTLMAIREWALTSDGAVLYSHDKGALTRSTFEAEWRRRITRELVGKWQHCLTLLARCDAAGCHWLAPGQDWPRPWPASGNLIGVSHPHFSGNFWWATASYLRRLPGYPFDVPHYEGCCYPRSVPRARGETTGRWLAELWIGLGSPQIIDLYPGMPGEYSRSSERAE